MVISLERKNALDPFKKDLYGVHSPLKDKRVARGWNDETFEVIKRGQPPTVQKLIVWMGGDTGDEVFKDQLDWESHV
jgi:hypothetical protein